MDSLLRDARLALRTLRRAPLVFALAALSLALGIAACTAVFSALDAFLIRPLPYPGADALVRVWAAHPGRGWARLPMTPGEFTDYDARSRTLALAAFAGGSMNIAGEAEAERVLGTRVSAGLFQVVGLRPALGRAFLPGEDRAGGPRVVVISDALWQRRFGADRAALGATLLLDGEPHEVIGIMAAGDYFPDRTSDIWTPLRLDGTPADAHDVRSLQVVGRLRGPATLEQAGAELAALAAAFEREQPDRLAGTTVQVVDLAHATFNTAFRTAAAVCMVAVLLVLLIACANVANLLLARATAREREIALRTALGAGRARVLRQLLTESLVLAAAGGALGTLFSVWGVRWLIAVMPQSMPGVDRVGLDYRALIFTAALSLGAGLLFGLAPALHASRAELGRVLREGGGRGTTTGARAGRLRAGLVVAQLSLAVVLLVCAGLLIRSYRTVAAADLRVATTGILTARLALPEAQYADTLQLLAFQQELLARLGAHPGVAGVALGSAVPLTGGPAMSYRPEGMAPVDEAEQPVAQVRAVTPAWFETFGLALSRGRGFTDSDGPSDVRVAVVSESFARRHWPDSDPIGRRIELADGGRVIVGVVSDYHEWGADEAPPAMFYLPVAQHPTRGLALALRTDLPTEQVAQLLRRTVRSLDVALPLYQVRSMAELAAGSRQQDLVLARLLGIFAAMALLLALIGVYGVMAYGVSQRTQEVGIRLAVGARPPEIVGLVVRQGMRLALTGIALGLLVAAGAARVLAIFLYGVSPHDPFTFGVVALALLGAALAASALPALRASRTDPVVALRVN